jgi:hypothetical protein
VSELEKIALNFVEEVKELLASPSFRFKDVTSDDVPEDGGVYVIFDDKGDAIYAGRTGNLRRRLLSNHRSGNVRGSQFRKALMQKYSFKNEGDISLYIREKCFFKFKKIKDPVQRIRLEHFSTAVLEPILNMKLKQ